METRSVTLGVIGGALLLSLAGLTPVGPVARVDAQTGSQTLPSVESRLSDWSRAKGGDKIPISISFGARLSDAQVEQLANRYGFVPYAVYMWSEGMTGIHRVDPSKASLGVIAEARQQTIDMKQKAQRSNQVRSQHFVETNPQAKVAADRELEKNAKFLLKVAEQNDKILHAAQSGAPLIFGLEALATPEQVRGLAQEKQIASAEPAVLKDGKALVPPVTPPAETRGSYRSSVEGLGAAEAYQRVQQKAGVAVNKGGTR